MEQRCSCALILEEWNFPMLSLQITFNSPLHLDLIFPLAKHSNSHRFSHTRVVTLVLNHVILLFYPNIPRLSPLPLFFHLSTSLFLHPCISLSLHLFLSIHSSQYWHKGCFSCEVCKMTLNMKNYQGFDKKPYCSMHYPKSSFTSVIDTPENLRLKQQSMLNSQVRTHILLNSMGQFPGQRA
ncbi:unnamed protein product [Coregonus sp. 'balchen']|nr:unnamed protein product [Coregonus sp. 'balchen']